MLLIRYIAQVLDSEGTDCIHNTYTDGTFLTAKEKEELISLVEEARKLLKEKA